MSLLEGLWVAFPVFFAFLPFVMMGVVFLFLTIGTVFWVWMLIDCVQRKFKKDNDRVIWVLIIVFLHWIGALVYYFAIKRKR
ncbi:PLDc N-terminal domain-containing protein [Candidatus Woesearchaeota archaeon]|nr:PLDc N-terminal domain-containing protein [Candidatus Woesearchaeota archaeon]